MQPRPTLKSMAATLGVHVSTVSRVLNGDPQQASRAASAEVVARVRALAQSLNYRPNLQATSLKTQRSRDIGVLLPCLADPLAGALYDGIDEAAFAAGYTALALPFQPGTRRGQDRIESALRRQVAGLIIGDSAAADAGLLQSLQQQVPCVLVGHQQPGFAAIGSDDYAAGQAVAEHFYRQGRRSAGLLAGPESAQPAPCLQGFIEYWQRQGLEVPPGQVLHSPVAGDAGHELGRRMLGLGVDALFAVHDVLAVGAMAAVHAVGRQVGRDVAVVGYHDLPWGGDLPVPLSSVRTPTARIGRLALQMLLRQVAGKAAKPLLLAPQLVVRASSC